MKIIKPTKGRILIELNKKPEKTTSGIILPDSKEDVQTQGSIIAVGEGSKFQIGTSVIFKEYSSTKINRDKDTFFIIDEEDIIATIEDEIK
ncbi:MAG: co-chaperone GroES [Methanogenium sp.]|jgi:chaperonin GroES